MHTLSRYLKVFTSGVRRLETESWMDCLEASSDEQYVGRSLGTKHINTETSQVEGVQHCWKIIQNRGAQPHEGLILQVLHTAARHGLWELAFQASFALKKLNPKFVLESQHWEPVLEACYKSGNLKGTNDAIRLMRQNLFSVPTTLPRLPLMDNETLDDAWNTLQILARNNNTVDLTILHTLLQECIFQNEQERALGYLRMASMLDLNPTEESYHVMLRAATQEQYLELADSCVRLARQQDIALDMSPYKYVGKLWNELLEVAKV